MRFSIVLAAAFAAIVSAAENAFTLNPGFSADAGKTVSITWTPSTEGTITLTLRSGKSDDLDKGTVIASKIPNSGKYSWSVPDDIPRGTDYALEISSDSGDATNYSGQFTINSDTVGGETPSSASHSASETESHSKKYPTMTAYSNHSSTTTKKSSKPTEKATLTTTTSEEPTQTESAAGGETSAPSGAAVVNNGAPMLALAIAGAVVAF